MTQPQLSDLPRPKRLRDAIPLAAAVALAFQLVVALSGAWLLVLAYLRQAWLQDTVLQRGAYTIGAGALGGALISSRYVVYAVRHSTYDPRRFLWQVTTPIWSSVLAGMGVLVVQSGVIAVSTSWEAAEPRYTMLLIAFSFFVGLASESFVKRLINAAESLFGERTELGPGGDDETKRLP